MKTFAAFALAALVHQAAATGQPSDSLTTTTASKITVSNTNADGYFWIGRCYESKGDKKKAIENYERALSLDKNFPEAARRLMALKK